MTRARRGAPGGSARRDVLARGKRRISELFEDRIKPGLERLPEQVWYQGHWLGIALAPLGWLYCAVAQSRRWAYQWGWLTSYPAPVPVIVVGNLTVGGTGKTPFVLWLVEHLHARGHRPGIALRGYRGQRVDLAQDDEDSPTPTQRPRRVLADSDPRRVGDEAVLLAQRASCPVMVGSDRVAVATALATGHGCDLVVTDDGLQHYRLQRDLEILVVDAARRFGNRRCLPAGPLREPLGRQRRVDLIIANGAGALDAFRMQMEPGDAVSLCEPGCHCPLSAFAGESLTAVAGIGNPQRFFAMLRGLGLAIAARPYPDHHGFSVADLESWPAGPVLMTEKDAVKCRAFGGPTHWYVPVTAVPEPRFVSALDERLDWLLGPTSRQGCPDGVAQGVGQALGPQPVGGMSDE